MEIIARYFPGLSDHQLRQLQDLMALIRDWNTRINVVSRKDIDELEMHHVLHCMAIGKYVAFAPGTRILDIGTGGGLPGLPLAILYPGCFIHMIDARQKKIKVVNDLIMQLGLENAQATHQRAEEHKGKYDFVVSRAVTTLGTIHAWSLPLLKTQGSNALPNGCIVLKGGDLRNELKVMAERTYVEAQAISAFFSEPYFAEKYIVYLQR